MIQHLGVRPPFEGRFAGRSHISTADGADASEAGPETSFIFFSSRNGKKFPRSVADKMRVGAAIVLTACGFATERRRAANAGDDDRTVR
jgi:hypothetical protein